MTFEEYLLHNNIMSKSTLMKFVDSAAISRSTLYSSIQSGIQDINGTEEQLLEVYCDFNKEYEPLTSSTGLDVDIIKIREIGGLDIMKAMDIMPLMNSEGQLLLIFRDPEIIFEGTPAHSKISKYIYQKCICTNSLYHDLWGLFIGPIEISKEADVFSDQLELQDVDGVHESDTRRLFINILTTAYKRRASDIHFVPCKETCIVKFRVDGIYSKYTEIPKGALKKIINIAKQDGHCPEGNVNKPVDGKASVNLPILTHPIDIRFSIIPSTTGEDLNIRYLSNGLLTFEQLGMSENNIKKFRKILTMPQGLVIQVGPTGSGKTTTLYSGLNYIKQTMANIIAIEDPVEITMDGITQIDVDSSKQEGERMTFPDAIKASLRHDPDVIVVGEIRDAATAAEAVRAATTGHLVLASLHTNDSISVFERLHNLNIDCYTLGEVLVAITSQRLVRRLCPHCKKKVSITSNREFQELWGIPEGITINAYEPVGCEKCSNVGYKGRIVINEILEIDSPIRDAIQSREKRSKFEQLLTPRLNDRPYKFTSMFIDGIDKVLRGITSFAEMEKFARDTTSFKAIPIMGDKQ